MERLQDLLRKLAAPVSGFALHPEVQKAVSGWLAAAQDDTAPVDWRMAENLAYASLLSIGRCLASSVATTVK